MKYNILTFIKYIVTWAWICPKSWENGAQRPKILKNDFFYEVKQSCMPKTKKKKKKIGKQLHVVLLSFYAILR